MGDVLDDAEELMLAPDGEDDQETQHVTMWNRVECRKVAGNAAPLRKNLDKYLTAHPECEVYCGQDKHNLGVGEIDPRTGKRIEKANEHVAIWHNTECRKITGNAAPLRKNLDAYLKRNPNCVIYNYQDRYLDKSIVGHKQKAKRPPFVPEEQRRVLEELQILPQIAQLSFMNHDSSPSVDRENNGALHSNATSVVSTEYEYADSSSLWIPARQSGTSLNSTGFSTGSHETNNNPSPYGQEQHHEVYLDSAEAAGHVHEGGQTGVMPLGSWVTSRVEFERSLDSSPAQGPESAKPQEEQQDPETRNKAAVYSEMPVAVAQLRKSLSIEQQLRLKQQGTGMSILLDSNAAAQVAHLEGLAPQLNPGIKSSLSFFLEQNGMGMKPSVSFLRDTNEFLYGTPMAMSIENGNDPLFHTVHESSNLHKPLSTTDFLDVGSMNMQTPQEFGIFFNHGVSLGKSMERPRPGFVYGPGSNVHGGGFAQEFRDASMGFSPSNFLSRHNGNQYME
ncbi:hypothetical protein FVE85_5238 [Porphyridium purpureum]|uniref:BRK domain-containing protein n=1 Tax=Porphyridium purpureum TaxID=35688 RepID=A0A5J4Z3W5_PORPP|nr:hypothetical protein FVE85_5238 [Porphyridium purpureum]|eukprot:POR6733..scf295_1